MRKKKLVFENYFLKFYFTIIFIPKILRRFLSWTQNTKKTKLKHEPIERRAQKETMKGNRKEALKQMESSNKAIEEYDTLSKVKNQALASCFCNELMCHRLCVDGHSIYVMVYFIRETI